MAYQERLHMLTKSGIALWDVCHSAERKGSLDAKIVASTIVPNDFDSFLLAHSQIQHMLQWGRSCTTLSPQSLHGRLPTSMRNTALY
jgi:hypoxanthine-DNA glycosylase